MRTAQLEMELPVQTEMQNNNYVEAVAEFMRFKPLKEFHPVHLVYSSAIKKYVVHLYSSAKSITFYPSNKIILSTETNKN